MRFITFNTRKKAEHYIKHLNKKIIYDGFYDISESYTIKGNSIVHTYTGDALCSSSDPYTGYICCSGNYYTETTVIGKIKKAN